MNKKYQVFVSSTYNDLREERAAVIQSLLDNDCIPVGMEQFHGVPISQWDYIKKMLDSSDYCILILAGKYGSIEENSGVGYTEKEFDYALANDIPVIRLLRKDLESLEVSKSEIEPHKKEKLQAFREKAMRERLADFYNNVDDLKNKVSIAINKAIKHCPRPGWTRSNDIQNLSSTPATPRQPKIYIELLQNKFVIPQYVYNHIGKMQYQPITADDIPEEYRQYISEQDIKNFNDNLPDKTQVAKYNYENWLYCANEQKTYSYFPVKVQNNGNKPANNIKIIWDLLEGIIILKKWTLENTSRPKEILPENPFEKALRLHQQKMLGVNYNHIFTASNALSMNHVSVLDSISKIDPQLLGERNWYIYDSDNEIQIEIDKLQHESNFNFDEDLVILPRKTGRFQIKARIICDEYPQYEEQIIWFDVVDKVS